MKILKYLGIISLISSYTILIMVMFFELSESSNFNLFNLAWGIGILNVIINAVYAIKIKVSDLTLSTFGMCGIIWFALPLVSDNFGIASLTIFLIIGIYIHTLPKNKTT